MLQADDRSMLAAFPRENEAEACTAALQVARDVVKDERADSDDGTARCLTIALHTGEASYSLSGNPSMGLVVLGPEISRIEAMLDISRAHGQRIVLSEAFAARSDRSVLDRGRLRALAHEASEPSNGPPLLSLQP